MSRPLNLAQSLEILLSQAYSTAIELRDHRLEQKLEFEDWLVKISKVTQ